MVSVGLSLFGSCELVGGDRAKTTICSAIASMEKSLLARAYKLADRA